MTWTNDNLRLEFEDGRANDTIGDAFRMALRQLFTKNKVGQPPVFGAGGDYPQAWTRDGALNCWNAGSLLEPGTASHTLLSLLTDDPRYGRVISEGHRQWWDKIVWSSAAWHHYEVTADREFLRTAYEATENTLREMEEKVFVRKFGLFRGGAFFQDGIAGYPEPPYDSNLPDSDFVLDYPEAHDIMCLSTNALYVNAYRCAAVMAAELEMSKAIVRGFAVAADRLSDAINEHLWSETAGTYGYFAYGEGTRKRGLAEFQEGAGLAFAVLCGVADARRIDALMARAHREPFGIPAVWPSFERFGADKPGRHNVLIWPQVNGLWAKAAIAASRHGIYADELTALTELINRSGGNIMEIYHPVTGEPYGGWQAGKLWESCNYQTWSATAYLSMVLDGLIGIRFEGGAMKLAPYLPDHVGGARLRELAIRGMTVDISIVGSGSRLAWARVNGVPREAVSIPLDRTGRQIVEIGLS